MTASKTQCMASNLTAPLVPELSPALSQVTIVTPTRLRLLTSVPVSSSELPVSTSSPEIVAGTKPGVPRPPPRGTRAQRHLIPQDLPPHPHTADTATATRPRTSPP